MLIRSMCILLYVCISVGQSFRTCTHAFKVVGHIKQSSSISAAIISHTLYIVIGTVVPLVSTVFHANVKAPLHSKRAINLGTLQSVNNTEAYYFKC
jgi:hypothetical protein